MTENLYACAGICEIPLQNLARSLLVTGRFLAEDGAESIQGGGQIKG